MTIKKILHLRISDIINHSAMKKSREDDHFCHKMIEIKISFAHNI